MILPSLLNHKFRDTPEMFRCSVDKLMCFDAPKKARKVRKTRLLGRGAGASDEAPLRHISDL